MHTAACLLDTEAGVKLVWLEVTPQKWASRMKRNNLLSRCTAPKQPLTLDGLTILHFRFSGLQTRVWSEVAPRLAEDLLHCTSFIDRFIRGIIPLERKFVPWKFHSAAIPACRRSLAEATTNALILAISKNTMHKVVQDGVTTTPIKVA